MYLFIQRMLFLFKHFNSLFFRSLKPAETEICIWNCQFVQQKYVERCHFNVPEIAIRSLR